MKELKQRILSYKETQRLSVKKVAAYKKIFRAIDADGDGSLSRDELMQGSEHFKLDTYGTGMEEVFQNSEMVDRFIYLADQDGDGEVDTEEFMVGAQKFEAEICRAALLETFEKHFDTDGDNQIDE